MRAVATLFGGAIRSGGGLDYVDWMVPGILSTVVLWSGMGAASGVAEDSASGFFDRLRSLPISRPGVLVGRAAADTILIAGSVLVTAGLAFLIGFRAHGSIGGVLAAGVLILVGAFAFSWVFIAIGLHAGSAQAAQGISMVAVPFSLVSAANVPVATMPGWMQPFAGNQPVTVLINAVRSLTHGGTAVVGIDRSTAHWVLLSLAWCGGIAAVSGLVSVRRFARRA